MAKSALRTRYERVFPDVYVARGVALSADTAARAGWLWSGGRAVVAGRSAAAVLGAKWIDSEPVELLHDNRSPVPGITVHGDRYAPDEVVEVAGIPTSTPARTALDLGCWHPLNVSVAILDSLSRATGLDPAEVAQLADRSPRRRGIRTARQALALCDGGAQSPKETWLRLILIEAGLPRPQTQIPVSDGYGKVFAYLDLGWPDIRVAVEYDGEQHRTDRQQYVWDLRRQERLERLGWIVVRVVGGGRPEDVLRRVRAAIARRASHQSGVRRRA